ncbi:MAG: STAS domain-containing protein [Armatimonadota bacterium]
MTDKLYITASVSNFVTILKISGEVDLYSIGDFVKAVDEKLEAGVVNLVIDLIDVTYLDSSGLAALLSIHRKIVSINGCLSIVTSPDKQSITHIFEITRLNTVFRMFNTVDEAVSYNSQATKV